MTIQQEFDEFVEWTKKSNILFVESIVNQNHSAAVFIPDGPNAASIFRALAEKQKTEVIFYDKTILDDHTMKFLSENIKLIDDEELLEKFNTLEPLRNAMLRYSLYSIENGVIFQLYKALVQYEIFTEVQENINNYLEENEYNEDYKMLEPSKIEEYGIKLAENENFRQAKNRMKRLNLLSELFPEIHQGHFNGAELVISKAETHFETIIKPKFEKELKEKILSMYENGMTKIKIASQLGISKDTVNKYT